MALTHPAARRLALLQLVGGPLVLASYALCILRWPDASAQMWGGVPDGVQPFYTAWMFVAAAGYFGYSWLFVLRTPPERTRVLGFGYGFLFAAYALVLVGSMLWMPMTKWLLDAPSLLRFWLVRLDLFAVAAGSLGLIVAAFVIEPKPDRRAGIVARVGTIAFGIQTIVLDALVWPALWPAW